MAGEIISQNQVLFDVQELVQEATPSEKVVVEAEQLEKVDVEPDTVTGAVNVVDPLVYKL